MDWGIRFLADPDLPGTGDITGAFWHPDGQIFAIASRFRLLTTPPARAATGGHSLKHRLALYRPPERRPIAVYDRPTFPINAVAFHPSRSVLAIGCGRYDGRHRFDGELILWDWEQNSATETAKVPEVLRIRFGEDGSELTATVRPWDDRLREGQRNPYRTFYELTLPVSFEKLAGEDIASRLDTLPPHTEPLGTDAFHTSKQAAEEAVADAFTLATLKQRSPICDVAAIGKDILAIAHDDCLLELYDAQGELKRSFKGAGHGVQIFAATDLVLHVNHYDETSPTWETDYRSQLMILTKGELKNLTSFEYAYTFSRSRDGLMLGRHNRVMLRVAQDVIVNPATGEDLRLDLGRYDARNHYLRVDGAPYLFFLQGTPPYSHERKQLCAVDAGGTVQRLWPLLESGVEGTAHATECCFEFVSDELGEGVIVAGKHANSGSTAYEGFLYRKSLKTGQELWRHKTIASASCIKSISAKGMIVAAFLDGGLALLRATNGETVRWEPFAPDGHASVVYSLAVDAGQIVLGTIDGRFGVAPINRFVGGVAV
jgi:hypothetical protein